MRNNKYIFVIWFFYSVIFFIFLFYKPFINKISSILLFNDKMAFHISRPVRWDSDHVVKLNDELQEVCDELVKCDALTIEGTIIADRFMDEPFTKGNFDASNFPALF